MAIAVLHCITCVICDKIILLTRFAFDFRSDCRNLIDWYWK